MDTHEIVNDNIFLPWVNFCSYIKAHNNKTEKDKTEEEMLAPMSERM